MPWKVSHMEEERFKFVVEVQKNEQSFMALCRAFGISRPTGYKWWQRYSEVRDPKVLQNRSKAPHKVHRKTKSDLEYLICECRRNHPTWGPEKILARLKTDYPWKKLPTISTAGRILKRNGLIKERKRRAKTPPYTKPFAEVKAPNQLWCIDFKGHFKTQDGTTIYPLTVTDAFSRYILCCEPLRTTELIEVGKVMEQVFKKYGLPEAIRSDNGVPFASTGMGGLTKLSVWWIKLGIRHERIDPGSPQQNGRHERMHRTLKNETCKNPARTFWGQNAKFRTFVKEFNEERPHQALQNKTPSEVYTPSMKEYRAHNIEHGFPKFGLDFVFINRYGKGEFNGKKLTFSRALADEFIDVYPNGKGKWAFGFGPVLLGTLDERNNKFKRGKSRKTVNHVSR